MKSEYDLVYEAEMRRRREFKERLYDINNTSHVITCDINNKITCDSHVKTHVSIPKDEYDRINQQLKAWNVVYRQFVLKHYPKDVILEAISRTKFQEKNLERPGGYFTSIIKKLYEIPV